MPAPRNAKEMKQFVGLVRYYWTFVPQFSDITEHLYPNFQISQDHSAIDSKGSNLQMDRLVPNSIWNVERKTLSWTHTKVSRYIKAIYAIHRCQELWMARCSHTRTQFHWQQRKSVYNLTSVCICKWTIQRQPVKLGSTHEGSICNIHVCEMTHLLHFGNKSDIKKQSPTTEEISPQEHFKWKSQ